MGELLRFDPPQGDLEAMDRPALEDYLAQLRGLLAQLDAREPGDMNSEAYDQWGEEHEALEDLLDEALDRLDELR